MEGLGLFAIFAILGVITYVAAMRSGTAAEEKQMAYMSPAERERYVEEKQSRQLTKAHGEINSAMICPHCQAAGKVRTRRIQRKKGVSGGKATAAIMTGGVSMLATGLSRNELMTHAYCENCRNQWEF